MKKKQLIFGVNAIKEALDSGITFEKVLFHQKVHGDSFRGLIRLLKKKKVPLKKVPTVALNRIYNGPHQGMIAFISPIEYHELEDVVNQLYDNGKLPFILILDQLTDVRNFGAISRSAHAFGVDALVLPVNNSVQISADAVKTSAGALAHLKVCRVNSCVEAVSYLKQVGLRVIGLTEKSSQNINDADLGLPLALVLGNEHSGISDDIMRILDLKLRIPMKESWDSLNVSVAAGIALYSISK